MPYSSCFFEMKITICTLFILITHIFISCTVGQDESLMDGQMITKSHPRKLKKLQILNPRKFPKLKSSEYRNRNLKKHSLKKEGYTFFPAAPYLANQGVSNNPLFQIDDVILPKVRVKKVLPDYLFTLSRGKRSITKGEDLVDSKDTIRSDNKTKKRKKKININININKNKHKNNKATTKPSLNVTINVNPTRAVIKPKHKRKPKKESSIQLKYTPKSRNRSRGRKLRKNKRAEKQNLREEGAENRHDNVDNTLRKKKRRRQVIKDSRRLIAGKDAMIEDYPYVVSIQKGGEHWCAGALLNQRLVITTANCIWKSDRISRLRIRAGSRHADRGGQLAKIQEVMKHPRWSIRRNPDNDVALILLDRLIKFSDKVHSLDLPNHAMMPAFEDAWVTSWGAERRDGIFENTQFTLQVVHSQLMDHEKCNNVTRRFGVKVSENFICLTQTGRRAPCTRDTGAPAVSDGILWGLASWGIRKLCGTERFPAMFSYMASPSNLEFITNATHWLMSEQRFYPFPDRFDVKRVQTTTVTPAPGANYM